MLRFEVIPALSKFLNVKHDVVKQPLRTYRKPVRACDRALAVKEESIPALFPPTGASLYVYNRNPRNLERLTIAQKNTGWTLEKKGRTFWHKLIVAQGRQGVKVSCVHQTGKVVMSASSDEWCIRKFIPRGSDKCAYVNVGRVFAHRCLLSGLEEMINPYECLPGGKVALLMKEIEDGGVTLWEPKEMEKEVGTTKVKPLRPWDVIID